MTTPKQAPPFPSGCKILLVDDTPENLRVLMELLKETGLEVATAINAEMALKAASSILPELILLDILMPGIDGYETCRRLKENPLTADIPVLFISALDKDLDKLKGFEVGGVDYISKPFCADEVLARVRTHLLLRQSHLALHQKNKELEQEKYEREKAEQELHKYQSHLSGMLSGQLLHPNAFKTIVTQSKKMHSLFLCIEALSCSFEPILITGESGVGKELITKAIHEVCCPSEPIVAVNIAGFDDNHFSDTLFGHVKGAFTGAEQDRAGLIESSAGGILFLDEIGDLSLKSQVKLLRLIQEKEYFPLGSDVAHKADCRIVVATNVNLKEKIAQGTFREDLYYRLKAHCLEIPPLRERKEDIPLLLEHFLKTSSQEMNKKKPSYPAELPVLLSTYSYPGNIREFRSMVYNALSKHKSHTLSMDSFNEALGLCAHLQTAAEPQDTNVDVIFPAQLPTLKNISSLLIKEALQRTNRNQSMAAKLLGVTPAALSIRLKKMTK